MSTINKPFVAKNGIEPGSNNSVDVGAVGNQFDNVYANNLQVTGGLSNSTATIVYSNGQVNAVTIIADTLEVSNLVANSISSGLTLSGFTTDDLAEGNTNLYQSDHIETNFSSGRANASGTSSIAIGTSNASGTSSIAIGNAAAVSTNSIAIGEFAAGGGYNSIAIGKRANYAFGNKNEAISIGSNTKTGDVSISIGRNATAFGIYAIAMGQGAEAGNTFSENYSTAIGYSAQAIRSYSLALGTGADANSVNSIAIGSFAQTAGPTSANNMAIGNRSYVPNDTLNAIAIGVFARSTANDTISIGRQANANGIYNIAVGPSSYSNGSYAVAIGYLARANNSGISIGYRANTHLQGIAIGNDSRARDIFSIAIGAGAQANDSQGIAIGRDSNAPNSYGVAVGYNASAQGQESTAFGYNAVSNGSYATAIGRFACTQGGQSVSLGNGAKVGNGSSFGQSGLYSIGIGSSANVNGVSSIGLGANTTVAGNSTVALGSNSKSTSDKSALLGLWSTSDRNETVVLGAYANGQGFKGIAIGSNATVEATGAIAIGSGALANATNAVAIGYGVTADTADEIRLGTNGHTTVIDGYLTVNNYVDLIPVDHPAHNEGRFYYDSVHKTLNYNNDISNINFELGTNEYIRVYNDTGSPIPKGAALYLENFTATDPVVPKAFLADATDQTKYNTSGLAAASIAAGAYGYCVVSGVVRGDDGDPFDTSYLTAGQRAFVSATTPGNLQQPAPSYPNFPMCMGLVVVSDANNGVFVVEQQMHAVPQFRVAGDVYVGSDLTVAGDFTVLGTETTVSLQNISVDDTFFYLGSGDTIANTEFVPADANTPGLDDALYSGYYEGLTTKTISVRIDSTGTPDTFEWSDDDFVTVGANNVAITGSAQPIVDNIKITFSATTGHTLGDRWDGDVTTADLDFGLIGNYSNSTLYSHAGFFRDASDRRFKFFKRYDPEIEGTVDTSNSSFEYADIQVNSIYGHTFSGNVTGTVTGTVTDISNHDTDDLAEGNTNLYYTTARANTDIDARVTTSFINALNADAQTVNGNTAADLLDYNNFTNKPTIPSNTSTSNASLDANNVATFTRADSSTFELDLSGLSFTNTSTSNATWTDANNTLTLTRADSSTYDVQLSFSEYLTANDLPSNTSTSNVTYTNANNTLTFTRADSSSYDVTGPFLPPTISLENITGTASAAGSNSISIGAGALSPSTASIAIGSNSETTGTYSMAIGHNSRSDWLNSITIGGAAHSHELNDITIGKSANSANREQITIGLEAESGSAGNNNITIGTTASSYSANSIAIGRSSSNKGVSTYNSIAIGSNTTTNGVYAIAIGYQSNAGHSNSIVIGSEVVSTAADQITLGKSSETVYIPGTLDVQALDANGSVGTDGQVLYSNGSVAYWGDQLTLPANTSTSSAAWTDANNTLTLTRADSSTYDVQISFGEYLTSNDLPTNTSTSSATYTVANNTATFTRDDSSTYDMQLTGVANTSSPTFSGDVTIQQDLLVQGNLNVTGTLTYINTNTLEINDNIITLAANQASGLVDAGIEVDRGSDANVSILWNETDNVWTLTNDGNTYANIAVTTDLPANTSLSSAAWTDANNTLTFTRADATTTDVVISFDEYLTSNVTTDVDFNSNVSIDNVVVTGNAEVNHINFSTAAAQIVSTGNIELVVADQVVIANSSGRIFSLPTSDGSSGQFITTNGSGTLSWGTPPTAAAGSDTQVQFNDGGSNLGGSSNFTFNKATNLLSVTTGTFTTANAQTVQANNTNSNNLNANAVTINTSLDVSGTLGFGNTTANLIYANSSQVILGSDNTGGLTSSLLNYQTVIHNPNEGFRNSALAVISSDGAGLDVATTPKVYFINESSNSDYYEAVGRTGTMYFRGRVDDGDIHQSVGIYTRFDSANAATAAGEFSVGVANGSVGGIGETLIEIPFLIRGSTKVIDITSGFDLQVANNVLYVDASTQKVGIGDQTPAFDLDVSGDINFTGTLYQNGVEFSSGGGVSEADLIGSPAKTFIYVGDGSNTVFEGADAANSTPAGLVDGAFSVYMNGIKLTNYANSDFTSNTSAITFEEAPANNSLIEIVQHQWDGAPFSLQNRSELTANAATTDGTTNDQIIDLFSATSLQSAKYFVNIKSGGEVTAAEVIVTHNGTTAYATAYGFVSTATNLGTFNADINSGNVRLIFEPASASVMTVKLNRIGLTL